MKVNYSALVSTVVVGWKSEIRIQDSGFRILRKEIIEHLTTAQPLVVLFLKYHFKDFMEVISMNYAAGTFNQAITIGLIPTMLDS